MPFDDLQQFVQYLEQKGQLKRVRAQVDPELEVTEIAQRKMRDRTRALNDDLGQPPGHVIEKSPSTNQPSLEQEPVPAVPVKKTVASADALS